jgi:hypothetical protein
MARDLGEGIDFTLPASVEWCCRGRVLEVAFPFEFNVAGVPVSLQAKRAESREQWKDRVRAASSIGLPKPHFATNDPLAVTIFYFPPEAMQGDVDNIVKPILDALSRHLYCDDRQVERVVVQKFEPQRLVEFVEPSRVLQDALAAERPIVHISVSNDPLAELSLV